MIDLSRIRGYLIVLSLVIPYLDAAIDACNRDKVIEEMKDLNISSRGFVLIQGGVETQSACYLVVQLTRSSIQPVICILDPSTAVDDPAWVTVLDSILRQIICWLITSGINCCTYPGLSIVRQGSRSG